MSAVALPLPGSPFEEWIERTSKFIAIMMWSGSSAQTLTVNGGSNYNLASDANFTALDKTEAIEVTLTGTFYATNTSNYAVDIGDLSTWTDVTVTIASGCVLWGMGGAGGHGASGAGTAGGPSLNVNSANSSSILTIVNNGEIGGGGGGGGGGTRNARTYGNQTGGKVPSCSVGGTNYGGGAGGGGGISGSTNSSGGSGGSSTGGSGCLGSYNGSAGSAGTISAVGAAGSAGAGYSKHTYTGSNCGPCLAQGGGNAKVGGARGTAGASAGGAGGAAGKWCDNRDHASWPSGYGTTYGGYTA